MSADRPPVTPPRWTGPGNDYRGILDLPPGPAPTVTVVVTASPETPAGAFAVTLDALADSAGDDAAGDAGPVDGSAVDGSAVDRRAVEIVTVGAAAEVPGSVGGCAVVTVDPDSDAPGARRNLGAAVAEGEVVLFLDAGAVPAPDLIARHVEWHRRSRNLVVMGHGGPETEAAGGARSRNERRSRQLLVGDTGFRTVPTANVSLRREVFDDGDGFTPWSVPGDGTDPLFGWRLWNDGFFLVPDPAAIAWPAVPADPEPDSTAASDDAARELTRVLADRIPHHSLRPGPAPLATVPKVSWLIVCANSDDADAAWDAVGAVRYGDVELILHGPDSAVGHLGAVAGANPKITVVAGDEPETFAAALTATRGELVALLDARVTPDPGALGKAVQRLDGDAGTSVVRHGYRIGGDRYLRLDDLLAVDSAVGRHGLPLFAVVRRREMMKDPALLATPHDAWSAAAQRTTPALVITTLVEVEDTDRLGADPPRPRRPGLGDLPAVRLRTLARSMVGEMRRRRASTEQAPQPGRQPGSRTGPQSGDAPGGSEVEQRLSVAYVGFTGHDNLGDEAVMLAIQRLMPWADLQREPADPKLVMVGGGTLLNGRRYYLNRMLRHESAVVERALFGTGVRSPEYWGVTEPMEEWFSFIDASLFAAVRGPDSVVNLRTLGYHRDLPVIGDPALSLYAPESAERVEGRVVVCPVYTSGNLHGGDDGVVFDALARTIGRYRAEGRDVVMMSAFPQDDRWVIDLMRRADAVDMPYVAGYADIDATMTLLASADLVIGERLHASIMAAAAGTPFVGLEYRPKVRDFARSVGQEDAVIRTDEMHRLDEVADRILANRIEVAAATAIHVAEYRHLQRRAADELQRRLVEVGAVPPTLPDATGPDATGPDATGLPDTSDPADAGSDAAP